MLKKDGISKKIDNVDANFLSRSDLTPDQLKIVKLPFEKNWLVLGRAGSGKTQVLIHRAAYLADAHGFPSNSYRLFVFTDMAREFIMPGAQQSGLASETVTTFDLWCRRFYENHVSKDLPRAYVNLRVDLPRIRSGVLRTLERNKELQRRLSFALVDDGQDLAPEAYEVLRLAARHITVFADFEQKIADNETSESLLAERLKIGKRRHILSDSYGSAPHVACLASYFIPDESLRRAYLGHVSAEQKVVEQPLCYIAPSFEEEMDLMAATIQMRRSMNKSVGIVVVSDKMLHELPKQLAKRGVKVEKVLERDAHNVLHEPYDFRNASPKIVTYSASKGMTFDTVFLPELTEDSFHHMRHKQRQRMLFAGMARARQWVYLSTVKGKEFKEINILRAAASDGRLLII